MDIDSIEKYEKLFEIVNKGIAIYETKDGINFIFKNINKYVEETEKLNRKGVIGKNILDVFPNVMEFGLLNVLINVYKTGIPGVLPSKIYNDKRISGWRENNVYKLSETEVIAVYDDLSSFKELEEALEDRENQFRSFFENNKAVILRVDFMTRGILECNKAAVSYYGYTKEELLSKTIEELNILPLEEIKIKMKRAVSKKSEFYEFKHKLSNGEIRDVEVYTSPINVNGNIQLFSIIHDVTERVKAQKAYIENQKINAMGKMLSSIAHDLSNSLETASTNIELCSNEAENISPEFKSKLKLIESNIEDIESKIKALLKLSETKDY